MLQHRVICAVACVLGCGCQHADPAAPVVALALPATAPTTAPASRPVATAASPAELRAQPVPPANWRPEPTERDKQSVRQVWVSPTRETGYGIVYFSMPLPFGPGLALPGFIGETTKAKGPTTLISRQADPRTGGISFIADLPLYRMHGIIQTRGFSGWVVYATTTRGHPVQDDEFALAVQARDATNVGDAAAHLGASRNAQTGIDGPSGISRTSPMALNLVEVAGHNEHHWRGGR